MNSKETLTLIIGTALGAAITKFTGTYAGWILLFLALFLLVIYVMQINQQKNKPTPLETI